MEKKRVVCIQLLRIIACLGVFVFHLGQQAGFDGKIREITDLGKVGVNLFFLISGFLAAKSLVKEEKISIRDYYLKRLIHICPLYYGIILFYFVTENLINLRLAHIPSDPVGLGWFRYVFFLNGFINVGDNFWNNLGITWTIPIFMFFYVMIPWLARCIKGYRSGVGLWVCVWLLSEIIRKYYDCTIVGYIRYLYLGVALFCIQRDGKSMVFAVLFQAFAVLQFVLGKAGSAYTFVLASILLCLIQAEKQITIPQNLQKWIDYADEHTYCMYLVHGVVFYSFLVRVWDRLPVWAGMLIAVFGSLVATMVVHKYYEVPVQLWLKRKLLNRKGKHD